MTPNTQTGSVPGVASGEFDSLNAQRVTVVAPGRTLLPDSGLARQLTASHPKYSAYNEYAFRSRMIKDPTFLDQYVEDVFELAAREGADEWMLDLEQVAVRRQRFKQNVINGLSKDMMTGQDVRSFIVDRQLGVEDRQLERPVQTSAARQSGTQIKLSQVDDNH